MKAYDVIGYAVDGALYHAGCEPGVHEDDKSPVFAGEAETGDYCDHCLHRWIDSTPADKRGKAPDYVYLDGCEPEDDPEDDGWSWN